MKTYIFCLLSLFVFANCQNEQDQLIDPQERMEQLYQELHEEFFNLSKAAAANSSLELDLNSTIFQNQTIRLTELFTEINHQKALVDVNEVARIQAETINSDIYFNLIENNLNSTSNERSAGCADVTCGLFCNTLTGKSVCKTNARYNFEYSLSFCLSDNNPIGCFFELLISTIQEIIRIEFCPDTVECCEYICL